MEHNKSLTRGAEGSVTALERLLEETRSEVDEKKAAVAELSTRLDQFQVLYCIVFANIYTKVNK